MQIFPPTANLLARGSLVGLVLLVLLVLAVGLILVRTSYITREGFVRNQPVMFSHEHHVEALGIDCRYCHTSVDESAFAGIPPMETCMNCHTQIFNDSSMLAPVRQAYYDQQPLVWTRVTDMPDFVYFNHSIHIARGVACRTCHGPVSQMPLMSQARPMTMQWCLDCHRSPLRDATEPEAEVLLASLRTAGEAEAAHAELLRAYEIRGRGMTNCTTCHR